MKKKIFAAVLPLLTALMTGCSAGRIHERSYLRALAVNGGAEKELTFAFFAEDGTVTATGNDIGSAKENAGLKNGRDIFTGYTELIIVDGKESRSILGEMLREWKVSPSCRVVYCNEGRKLLEENDTEKLLGIAGQAVKQGIAPECDIITVLGELCEYGAAEAAELYPDGTAGRHIIS
ncbi:MAG: hypothetical protein J6X85_03985 [Ruminococcus sp.]|nr:hypothetical protein [Ruminococcus sp.]